MLNTSNYLSVQATVSSNLSKYMPIMMLFKSEIQRAIIPMLPASELQDIKDCRFNTAVVNKLTMLGEAQYQQFSEHSNEILYCLCMAIGTIIKEYDWGTDYITQPGMCELAKKIMH